MEEDFAVHCRALTKHFGAGRAAVQALRGIELQVRVGELLMLVGPSGSGKTTLISIMAGILNRDSGECRVFGHDYEALSDRKRTRLRGHEIGFVFQAFNLIPTLTVAENIAVPLLVGNGGYRKAHAKAIALLGEVGLSDRYAAAPFELSGGEQQRVAICRALIHHPRLIVCDEPTSQLDHKTGVQVMTLLRDRVRRHGRTLIVVTHDQRIFQFADRIAKIDDGRIVTIMEGESSAENS